MRKKRYRYTFTGRKQARGGVAALGYGAGSLIFFGGAMLITFIADGNYALSGALGLIGALFAFTGFVFGVRSFSQPGTHGAGIVGSLLTGILLAGWIGIFLTGLVK